MQDLRFLKTDVIQDDLLVKSDFLAKAEELLASSSFQGALELARNRLSSIPGDIDARMILGRALMGLGKNGDAVEILSDIRRNLERWSSMLDLLENPVRGHASSDLHFSGEAGGRALQGDFYTMTMAELFINQGHHEMARQVLEGILKIDPSDTGALERLEELKRKSINSAPEMASGIRSVAELERWLSKLKTESRS